MADLIRKEKVLVTGGAGFLGSCLVDRLCEGGSEVVVLDALTTGKKGNLKRWLGSPNFAFAKIDLSTFKKLPETSADCQTVFHLAANPDVRSSSQTPVFHYRHNVLATFNLLEAIRQAGNLRTLVFTSTSTVYGDADKIPTAEDYAPLKPVSIYGATKLASEALIASYANIYGFDAVIFRLANIVGARSGHGVIRDFIDKLTRNSKKLEILGDGTQTKSYLHVDDCIDGMLTGVNKHQGRVDIFNVGSEDQVSTRQIADVVTSDMGLTGVEYQYTGGVDGGRGWKGDVKCMLLDVRKLKKLGWRPRLGSHAAIKKATRELLSEVS